MRSKDYFRVGFAGATTDSAMDWAVALVDAMQARRIVIPFTGSGKDVAAFAQSGRTIHSFDTQEMSNVLVNSFANPFATNLGDIPFGVPGYARSEYPISEMDEGNAQLLNYIATRGSWHDRAALVKTLFRCTAMGRLNQWKGDIDTYRDTWQVFMRARESMKNFADLPGVFFHTFGSCLECVLPPVCDVIYIDPPKVLERTDLYSGKAYTGMNSILLQRQAVLPQWKADTYLSRIQQILAATSWRVAILFHASGLTPTLEAMISGMPVAPAEVKEFGHEQRIDYAIVMCQDPKIPVETL